MPVRYILAFLVVTFICLYAATVYTHHGHLLLFLSPKLILILSSHER